MLRLLPSLCLYLRTSLMDQIALLISRQVNEQEAFASHVAIELNCTANHSTVSLTLAPVPYVRDLRALIDDI